MEIHRNDFLKLLFPGGVAQEQYPVLFRLIDMGALSAESPRPTPMTPPTRIIEKSGKGAGVKPKYISVSEAAKRLGVTPRTVNSRIRRGEVKATRKGEKGRWKVLEAALP